MVKTYVLEGKLLQSRESAHQHLAQALELPEYYGMNLDALYDCLTEMGPCTILLRDAALLQADGYGARVLAVLWRSALENPSLHVTYAPPDEE